MLLNPEYNLAHSDLSRMYVAHRKVQRDRRRPTPEWVLNNELLRAVITRYIERQAGMLKNSGVGAYQERLARAEAILRGHTEELRERMFGFLSRYERIQKRGKSKYRWTEWWRRKRLRGWAIQIANLDKRILILQRPGGVGALACSIALYYWRLGWDATTIANELGIGPPHVRQTLDRLCKVGKEVMAQRRLAGRVPRLAPKNFP